VVNSVEISDAMVAALSKIDGSRSPYDASYNFNHSVYRNVKAQYEYFDSLSIPAIRFSLLQESREYHGKGDFHSLLTYDIRAYIEQGVEGLEDFIEDMEHVLKHLNKEHSCIHDTKIQTIETDEGALDPLGVVKIIFDVRFIKAVR
jgi:hypothetical protein